MRVATDCRTVVAEFCPLVNGELDADAEDAINAHLVHCVACRRELERTREIHRLLQTGGAADDLALPAGLGRFADAIDEVTASAIAPDQGHPDDTGRPADGS